MKIPHILAVALLAGAAFTSRAGAQDGPRRDGDVTIDARTRREVIDGVLARLDSSYVYPEKAREMGVAIRARLRRGEYDRLTSGRALADSLTAHLRAVSHDGHLHVEVSADPIPVPRPGAEPEMRERQEAFLRRTNYGVAAVQWLEGNVGYLELRGFVPARAPGAPEAVAAAMSLLSRTDALIVDLRHNGGGDPAMVRLVASYLFGADSVHLNSLHWRAGNRTDEFWTLTQLAGPRYGPERPVYVLTSHETFSAAEEFTYDLQSLHRATVVGEVTGGGAHPGGMQRIDEHFAVWVPTGRAINPVTGTDWEGTGVHPEVSVAADKALPNAHMAALRALLERATDPEQKRDLQQAIDLVAWRL